VPAAQTAARDEAVPKTLKEISGSAALRLLGAACAVELNIIPTAANAAPNLNPPLLERIEDLQSH
jgi:hypothetical protein